MPRNLAEIGPGRREVFRYAAPAPEWIWSVETVMLLKVDHEVAPAEQAYGKDNGCTDCHFSDQIEWTALGWTKNPATGGTQTLP
jgi:hypothetical protein